MPPSSLSAASITRREQQELDELLSDIYRGIEALPDKSRGVNTIAAYSFSNSPTATSNRLREPTATGAPQQSVAVSGRALVREYELPASSPLVKQYRQDALREQQLRRRDTPPLSKQPQRSTLKRNTPDGGQAQSLASFITNRANTPATPENKRRVRIVDKPAARLLPRNDYSSASEDEAGAAEDVGGGGGVASRATAPRVKYVNTNKFIYHQERNPDDNDDDDYYADEQLSERSADVGAQRGASSRQHNKGGYASDDAEPIDDADDDDLDGATRVEYYHTSWLDRQLGRASKRRSSKELSERQVKEKAMIEELKRSLKNGAITLRQSFKGAKKGGQAKQQQLSGSNEDLFGGGQKLGAATTSRQHNKKQASPSSSVFGSGLATLPRDYHNKQQRQHFLHRDELPVAATQKPIGQRATPKQTSLGAEHSRKAPLRENTYQEDQLIARHQMQCAPQAYSSRTLPHRSSPEHHTLLQSHYRTAGRPLQQQPQQQFSSNAQQKQLAPKQTNLVVSPQQQSNFGSNAMRQPAYTNSNTYCGQQAAGSQHPVAKSPLQLQQASTVNNMPSATEVVRSALSRSSSQVSVNQLNKTINLLPTSPSPTTPTQLLRAASPSLSPSPCNSPMQSRPYGGAGQRNQHVAQPASQYSSKTLGHQPSSGASPYGQNRVVLHGTRTIPAAAPVVQPQAPARVVAQQQQRQHQPQQPVYANPHASLMQHRIDQQQKQPNRNVNSVREFNELDSLLRSLSSGSAAHTTAHVTPGYSSKPSQPSFGGYMPQRPQPTGNQDIYAKVQKQQAEQRQQYNQQANSGLGVGAASGSAQPFTIDVTNKKDENCLRQQELSEFEPRVELLPSMEDYQNILKLSPVKNYFWYKPSMSRERAINLLRDKPQGTFIVRDSTSFAGAFGLAVRVSKLPRNAILSNFRSSNGEVSDDYIRHFLIEPSANGVRLRGYANEPVFDNLPSLIYQHSLTELALPCKLVIPRADIEDPRFNQKQKQFFDEFLASKEQAKHMPYERTSPDGGYRKYPGDVYVHNEHRIIFE